jgi:hypothetical protein
MDSKAMEVFWKNSFQNTSEEKITALFRLRKKCLTWESGFREKELIKIEKKKFEQYCMSLFLSSHKWKAPFCQILRIEVRQLLLLINSCQDSGLYSSKIYNRSSAKPHAIFKC